MLYIIGLGLNDKGYSREAYDAILNSKMAYVDGYTVDFPYGLKELEKQFKGKKFIKADRNFVESFEILRNAKSRKVAFLVYGSPLTATTHISLIQEAKKRKIKLKVIHSASVLDAVAETGLQLYKFGKIASMPNFQADSYIEIVMANLDINAHSLVLVDIGMDFRNALSKLEEDCNSKKLNLGKILLCSRLGTKDSKVYYGHIKNLISKKVKSPFCFIIPARLHFIEKEFLEGF